MYLFSFVSDDEGLLYFASPGQRTPFLSRTLPAVVNSKYIGRTYGELVIRDVAPAGSEFMIDGETHEVTEYSGIRGTPGYPMGLACVLYLHGVAKAGVLTEFIQIRRDVAPGRPAQDIDGSIAERLD